MKLIFLSLFILTTSHVFGASLARKNNDDDLTQALAVQRKAQVKSISYALHFELQKKVAEYKVETVCENDKIQDVIRALKEAHPYETPAYDVWKLEAV